MAKKTQEGGELRQAIWSVISDGARVAEHLTYDEARGVSSAHVGRTGKHGTYIVTDKAASACPAVKSDAAGGKRRPRRPPGSKKK